MSKANKQRTIFFHCNRYCVQQRNEPKIHKGWIMLSIEHKILLMLFFIWIIQNNLTIQCTKTQDINLQLKSEAMAFSFWCFDIVCTLMSPIRTYSFMCSTPSCSDCICRRPGWGPCPCPGCPECPPWDAAMPQRGIVGSVGPCHCKCPRVAQA